MHLNIYLQVLEEAKIVLGYRDKELTNPPKSLCLGLTSRRNLCIHPRVGEEKEASRADAKCRNLTASWVRNAAKSGAADLELCEFYEVYFISFFIESR